MKFILVLMIALAIASGKPAEEQKQEMARAACPLYMCAIYCPNGFVRDENGCIKCQCNDDITVILP